MRIKKAIGATLVLVTLSVTTLLAQQRPGPPPGQGQGDGPSPLQRCLQILNLSEAQQTQVKGIFDTAAPQLKALHEQLKSDEEALRTAITATTPDACAVGNAALKVHSDREALRAQHESVKTQIEAVLTVEQKAKLEGCMERPRGPRN